MRKGWKKQKLQPLGERRERGDLIMMFKVIRGMENVDTEDIIIREGRWTNKGSWIQITL